MISWHRSLATANTSSSATPITGSTPIIEQPSSQSLLKTEDVPDKYSAKILSELVQICKPNAAPVKTIQAQYFHQGPAAKISDAADHEKLMMNPALWTKSSWSLTLMDPERVPCLSSPISQAPQHLVDQIRKIQDATNSHLCSRNVWIIFARFRIPQAL